MDYGVATIFLGIVLTIWRARQQSVPWINIAAVPTQWLYFIIFGGAWGHTICSCVGKRVRDGSPNPKVWRFAASVLNALFSWVEKDHCLKSLERVEKYQHGHKSSTIG